MALLIPIITTAIGIIPSLIKAVSTVMDVEKDTPSGLPYGVLPGKKELADHKLFKRDNAVKLLSKLILPKLKAKYGWTEKNIGTLVDLACLVYKSITFKKKKKVGK